MKPRQPRKFDGGLTPLKSVFTLSLVLLCIFFPFGFSDNPFADMLLRDLLLVIIIGWLLRLFKLPFDQLGFHRFAPTEYLFGIGAGILLIGINLGLSSLSEALLGPVADYITSAYEKLSPHNMGQMLVLGTEIIIITPFLEEIIFRSLIFRGFRSYGFWPAALLASFIYALLYLNPWAALPVFVMAMVLCWVYEKTGNLSVTLLAHLLANIAFFLELAGLIKLESL